MSHPYYHAKSAVRRWGGTADDYLPLESWMDQSKAFTAHTAHRAWLHNSAGIFLLEEAFGLREEVRRLRAEVARLGGSVPGGTPVVWTRESDGKEIPIRLIGELHVQEDLGGQIPSLGEMLDRIPADPAFFAKAERLSEKENV